MLTYKKCLALVLIFIFSCVCCAQNTQQLILTYPQLMRPSPQASRLASTVFHEDTSAINEAMQILQTWETRAVSVPWTRIMLDRYVKHKMMPTRGARGLALLHVAMHDAFFLAEEKGVNSRIALSAASVQVLRYLFVTEEGHFDRLFNALMKLENSASMEAVSVRLHVAQAIGDSVGRRVVEYAEDDGAQKGWNGIRLQYYGEDRYFGPGTWEPTAPYFYYPPDEPFAPVWKTWVLESGGEFRLLPPRYGSPRYMQDLLELIEINKKLSESEKLVARKWVDGHGTVTPPGHWNVIAIDEALAAQLDNKSTVRLFAMMNIALADTFIAVWYAKYHYWTARPISVAKRLLGEDLTPLLLTPPFPSYVSGHAGFSGAAAKIIGAYIPHRAKALDVMAEEAAHSRLLGGIHFRHDNEDGLWLGRQVAQKVLNNFSKK